MGVCELAIYRYLPRYWLREAQRDADLGLGLIRSRNVPRKKRFKAWPDRAQRLPRLLSGT